MFRCVADPLQRSAADRNDTVPVRIGSLECGGERGFVGRLDDGSRRSSVDLVGFYARARTSPHTAPLGKILSGLKRCAGSRTSRTRAITARSSVENRSASESRFSYPIPCSPEIVPP